MSDVLCMVVQIHQLQPGQPEANLTVREMGGARRTGQTFTVDGWNTDLGSRILVDESKLA